MKEFGDGSIMKEELLSNAAELCRGLSIQEPSYSQLVAACSRLCDMGLLQIEICEGVSRTDKIGVHVQTDDICFALKNDAVLGRVAVAISS